MRWDFLRQWLPRRPQSAAVACGVGGVPERPPLTADGAFWAVLLVWAFCWLGWALYLASFTISLPFIDEYVFVEYGIATGEQPLTWDFLWAPANEHRAPLTRYWCVLLGRAFNWHFRPMLQCDLALFALGCLPLLFAVRSVRGRSSLCDCFLPLVLLSSVHQATLANYVYAYAMAVAVWCATAAAVLARWHLRSAGHLTLYVLGALAVAWAGGPPGNLWALGLCVPLALGWFERTGRLWKLVAVVGGAAIVASAALLLWSIPRLSGMDAYYSESSSMTFSAACKLSVGWMGAPVLLLLYPWALLALGVPLLWLLLSFLGDVRRLRGRALIRWSDLSALLAAALLVAVAIAQGRGKHAAGLWDSRYCTLVVPIAVVLFLALVRSGAPEALTGALAVGMAVCVGWSWPGVIDSGRWRGAHQKQLVHELREGHEPLGLLIDQYAPVVCWQREWGYQKVLAWWQKMRAARISVFDEGCDSGRCVFWPASDGTLVAGELRPIQDPDGVNGYAVEAGPGATAAYEIAVPEQGDYKLCCRWHVPESGRSFAAGVDDGPLVSQAVPDSPSSYVPCVLSRQLRLEAGKHRLVLRWPGPGSRLDVFELTPQ